MFPSRFHCTDDSTRRAIASSSAALARGSRAFTLVEILVVIIILGIASAVIIPQIGSRDDLKASAAARVVMADLVYAQNRAISQQRPQYVSFSAQQYLLSESTGLAAITHPVTKNPYTITFNADNATVDDASLSSWSIGGANVLGFDELGAPFKFDGVSTTTLGAAAQIVVQAGDKQLTIQVEPFTGETTVN
jgi:prepilin-type N-terminal cleavage/methylation domain-containing protein